MGTIHPNPTKTCLLVGEKGAEMAKEVFQGTGISVTEDGKQHIGVAIGTQAFVERYMSSRKCLNGLMQLSVCPPLPIHNPMLHLRTAL